MLNTRNEEKNAVFDSYVACFVNTVTLNIYVSISCTELAGEIRFNRSGAGGANIIVRTHEKCGFTRRGAVQVVMMIYLPPRDTSPHQDSAGTAPSGTPPPAQPPSPPQTRETQVGAHITVRTQKSCSSDSLELGLTLELSQANVYIHYICIFIYSCLYTVYI